MQDTKKLVIGIDIDSVIADSIELFLPFLNERFNKNLKLEDIVYYEFEKCYNVSQQEILEAFKDLTKHKLWLGIPVIDFAKEFMEILTNLHTTVIVTSRPEKFMKDVTIDWLKKNEIKYKALLFMDENNDADKYQTGLKAGYKFDVFIEDCYEFAVDILKYDIPVILIDYPWNRKADKKNLIRMQDLRVALKYLEKLSNQLLK